MKKNYVPQPVNTNDVQLPAELDELVEKIAKKSAATAAKKSLQLR